MEFGPTAKKTVMVVAAILITVCCLFRLWQPVDQISHKKSKQIQWGGTFGGLAPSKNVRYDCEHNGHKICCGLLSKQEDSINSTIIQTPDRATKLCRIEKTYIPSAYETVHLNKAWEISKLASMSQRKSELIQFISADIPASNAWLRRVKEHMSSEDTPAPTNDDYEYLSRFHVTKTCPDSELSSSWIEWIEPLSVHARHPFALMECNGSYSSADKAKFELPARLQSLDYILIQSGKNLHEATALANHNHTRFAAHHNHHVAHSEDHVQTHNYMLDAGTSTFESSMQWFLCAYLQRKIPFDQEYGYEYTLLEPQDFWKRVPAFVKPFYHFFNAPIAPGLNDEMSPLWFIKNIATPDDFVALKLDVDTPKLEIPLALALAKDEEIARLVDEFFFELHFQCEFLMFCGWGDSMPAEYLGIKLDRYHAMKFFQDMRAQGIRAHFWP